MGKLLAALAIMLSVAPALQAQSLVDAGRDSVRASQKIIPFGSGGSDSPANVDSVRRLIDLFYFDQFHSFSDPDAPYFLFMSRDATLAMGIGGAVRMRAYYDWHGAIPATAFIPYLIPMHPDPASMRHYGSTPAGTCLFFRVLGRNKRLGNYQLYIEADFSGYKDRDFTLKKAYARLNDVTVGYDVTTFSDPAALPPMVDANGPSNKISPSTVLLRYSPRLGKHWTMAASIETPATAVRADGVRTAAVRDWLPDVAAFVQYEWGRSSHVRLAGILRSLSYRDEAASANRNRLGRGALLSSVAHLGRCLTTYASVNYGRGYASLGGDLSIEAFDLIPDPDEPGRLYAPASVGWCAGLQWNFCPELFVCVSASSTRIYRRDGASMPDEFKRSLLVAANCFWNMTPRIQVGAEFLFGRRTDYSRDSRDAFRAGALAMFSF